jgi:hypothetical protein
MAERKNELWKMLAWMATIAVLLYWIGPVVFGVLYMALSGVSP